MSHNNLMSLKTKGKIILWMGVVLLVFRAALFVCPNLIPVGNREFLSMNISACCLRMGLVLLLLGLAWDTVIRIPPWLLLAVPFAIVVLVFRPQLAWYLIPIIFGLVAVQRFFGKIEKMGKTRKRKSKRQVEKTSQKDS